MRKINHLLLTSAMIIGFSTSMMAADKGQKLYMAKTCHTCHGPKGKAAIPTYPNLAGQNKQYIINQVLDIKNGKRNSGMTMLMKANPFVK
ncbi:MAG: c-type cytochrome, partial [Proteobacteria bacterium]|nr:c-type cytochrome [Pseudomonadota bacterium]